MTGPQLCADDHEPIAYRAGAIGCPLCLERAGRPLPARVDGPWNPLDEYSAAELREALDAAEELDA